MHKKRNIRGAIYAVCLIVVFVALLIGIKKEKEEKTTEENTVATVDTSETVEANGRVSTDPQKVSAEISEANKPANAEYHKGEYVGRADSREVNSEFIIDECTLQDPYDGVEIQFLAYNEMENLCEYIDKDGFIKEEVKAYYISTGIMNEDGTFNKVTQKVRDRLDNNLYANEVTIEDYEFAAIKLKVRIKNTENNVNKISLSSQLGAETLLYMDDGKLYRSTSVYNYDYPEPAYFGIIYHSFMDYFTGGLMDDPTSLMLEPFQELEGEIIYIVGKRDIDNAYIICHSEGCDIENFKGVYIQFLPFSLLKNLPSE